MKQEGMYMLKKALGRAVCSMGITSLLSLVTLLAVELCAQQAGFVPLLPDFLAHFSSPTIALGVYHVLVGLIGAGFGGFSVLFEIERWSFLKQGVAHFLLTTAVWLPICAFLWGLGRYPQALFSILVRFTATYIVTWLTAYQRCREAVRRINERLAALRAQEDDGTHERM